MNDRARRKLSFQVEIGSEVHRVAKVDRLSRVRGAGVHSHLCWLRTWRLLFGKVPSGKGVSGDGRELTAWQTTNFYLFLVARLASETAPTSSSFLTEPVTSNDVS